MAVPGFDDPALAAPLASGNLYFAQDVAVAQQGAPIFGYTMGGPAKQPLDSAPPQLMFGSSATHTAEGAPIVNTAKATKGHVSEILNFHGSPAPWILLGILVVAGIIHLSVKGKVGRGVFGASV